MLFHQLGLLPNMDTVKHKFKLVSASVCDDLLRARAPLLHSSPSTSLACGAPACSSNPEPNFPASQARARQCLPTCHLEHFLGSKNTPPLRAYFCTARPGVKFLAN